MRGSSFYNGNDRTCVKNEMVIFIFITRFDKEGMHQAESSPSRNAESNFLQELNKPKQKVQFPTAD